MNGTDEPPLNADANQATRPVAWKDFREHLATAEPDGSRRWIYAKRPKGRWYDRRTWLSYLLLGVMFVGPFITIGGNPLLMFNIVERRFSILGFMFWPMDSVVFAVAMLTFFAGIMVFTAAFGRLWCGWTCPQTVLMEMVFRKLEYLIEGDAVDQRRLAAAPWGLRKASIKTFKHAIFFGLSFIIGNTLLAYIIGWESLYKIMTDPPAQHLTGLVFMVLFTLLFYAIFARFREQACTFICPYGRFQSALLDENTMVVAYHARRGENRAAWNRNESPEERRARGTGDCIDCGQCVSVCPTGIDIRNGLQMECVNCTACMDACDGVMRKIGLPERLIGYASQNSQSKGEPMRFTNRMKLYSVVLGGLIGLFLFLVVTRPRVQAILLRAPGALYQVQADGRISNLYTIKVINKTKEGLPIQLRLMERDGVVQIMGASPFMAPGGKLVETSILVMLDPKSIGQHSIPLKIGMYSGDRLLTRVQTSFMGPRN